VDEIHAFFRDWIVRVDVQGGVEFSSGVDEQTVPGEKCAVIGVDIGIIGIVGNSRGELTFGLLGKPKLIESGGQIIADLRVVGALLLGLCEQGGGGCDSAKLQVQIALIVQDHSIFGAE